MATPPPTRGGASTRMTAPMSANRPNVLAPDTRAQANSTEGYSSGARHGELHVTVSSGLENAVDMDATDDRGNGRGGDDLEGRPASTV